MDHGAEVLHANAHMMDTGVSVYEELTHATSSYSPCRTTFGGRSLPNTLLNLFVFKHKCVGSPFLLEEVMIKDFV